MMITVEQAAELLKQSDDIAVLCHANPDGDTLGSGHSLCRALQLMGKKATVLCADAIPNGYLFMKAFIKEQSFTPKFIVTVDVAAKELLGDLKDEFGEKVDLAIDHHISNTGYAKNTLLTNNAANAEIVYDLIKALGVSLDNEMAAAIYTGISTDTGCFRFQNTTARSHSIAGELMQFDYDFGRLNYNLFDLKTKTRLKIESSLLEGIEFYFDGKVAVALLNKEQTDLIGNEDISGLSAIPRQIEGVEASVMFKQKSDHDWKVSIRTNSYINAQKVCGALGGGGHVRAGGCKMSGSLSDCKEKILKEIEKHM